MEDVGQLINDRNAQIEAISRNPELTEEAKQGRISAVREAYREEYEQARAAEQARVQERFESAHKAVYRVPTGEYSSEARAPRSRTRSADSRRARSKAKGARSKVRG
jgi:hypothetical protein